MTTHEGIFTSAIPDCQCRISDGYYERKDIPSKITQCLSIYIYIYIYIGHNCTGPTNTRPVCNKCLMENPGIKDDGVSPCICSPLGYYEEPKDQTLYPGEFACHPCHDICIICKDSSSNKCAECFDQPGIFLMTQLLP